MRVEALAPGTLVAGRFEIDRFVGSGGMGVVYRARDLQARAAIAGAAGSADRGDRARFVALKLLRVDTLGQIGGERFVREARLLSQLQHPGIVAYVADGTTEDGQPYLAMEWLEGIDLGQRVRKRPLSIAEALVLLERMASILSATHARGIIHRDLKPSNLFLPDGAIEQVKVLDFGVARVADVRSGTQTGLIVGTPAYMSPEQARGLREITPAVDIYSLGCLLYECLSGRPPFPADQPAATLVRVLFEEPRPLELLCPGVPASLIELQRRMMEKNAAARPPNGQALVEALRELRQQSDLREALLSLVPAAVPIEVSDSGWLSQGSLSLLCVVFASLPATVPSSYGLSAVEKARLLAALQRMGAGVECLTSGALLVTVGEVGNAVEQASLGAQAALLVKDHWPSAAIALTTGRGRWQGQETTGSAVQRGQELWAVAQAGAAPREHGEARGATVTPSELPPILLDEVSAHLLDGRFDQAEIPSRLGRVLRRPLDRPLPIRQLFGGPTPLCGREVELSFLERQLSTCSDDHKAQVVLLTAVPGVGKTRLLHEFLGRVGRRTNPPRIYTAGGLLRSAGGPYSLARRLLRGAFGLPQPDESDSSDVETIDQKPTGSPGIGRVPGGDGAFVQVFLSELCGVPCELGSGEDEARMRQLLFSARREPRLMHQHLRRAFVSWLGTQCQKSAVLIALDDLHWGDALSVSLIDDALRELR
ncbi:MAG TPA: protein kinase, partial [Pseudomonadota bacterium]|nr:protein kinase [Pseudomonadota bacterium]